MALRRVTICVEVDDVHEREFAESWLEKHQSSLTSISENLGCGCCVDMWDIEGEEEVVSSLPKTLLAHSDWASGISEA